jgi:hypothetical protein
LIAERVPTGIKIGVFTTPWGVWIVPARAAPSRASNLYQNEVIKLHQNIGGSIEDIIIFPNYLGYRERFIFPFTSIF